MGKYRISRRHLNKNRRLLNISLIIVSILVFGVVTAYAALNMTMSSRFNLVKQYNVSTNGSGNSSPGPGDSSTGPSMNSGTFSQFSSYAGYYSSYNYNTGTYTGQYDSIYCGSAYVSGNRVTVSNVYVSAPGSFCAYEISIRNTGSPARISSVTPINATGQSSCYVGDGTTMVCGNHTYGLTDYVGNSTMNVMGNLINGYNSTTDIYLVVKFNNSYYIDSNSYNGGFELTFGY